MTHQHNQIQNISKDKVAMEVKNIETYTTDRGYTAHSLEFESMQIAVLISRDIDPVSFVLDLHIQWRWSLYIRILCGL